MPDHTPRPGAALLAGVTLASTLMLACAPSPSLAHGDGHARLAELDARIAAQPGDAGLYLRRGRLLIEEAHYDRAQADLSRALALDPAQRGARHFLAEALLADGKPQEAEAQVKRFIDSHGDQDLGALSRGHWLLGQARMADHRPEPAVEAYRAALKVSAEVAPDHYQLFTEACLTTGKAGYFDEALALLDRGLASGGGVDQLEELAIGVELKAGRMDAALARLDHLIAHGQRLPFLYARKAAFLRDLHRDRDAMAAIGLARLHLERVPDKRRRAPAYAALDRDLHSLEAGLDASAAQAGAGALKP